MLPFVVTPTYPIHIKGKRGSSPEIKMVIRQVMYTHSKIYL